MIDHQSILNNIKRCIDLTDHELSVFLSFVKKKKVNRKNKLLTQGQLCNVFYFVDLARRILEKCDAVLRIEGDSKGADGDVKLAKERGLPIYFSIDEIPWADL